VNVASRIESATKEFGVPVLVSQSTRDAAHEFAFVDLGATGLKGKTSETRIYALHDDISALTPDFADFIRLHEQAMTAAGAQSPQARALIEQAAQHPQGARYRIFYKRILTAASGDLRKA